MNGKIKELITKFLSGETTSADEDELNRWLGEKDENIREFAGIEKLWNAIEIADNRKKYDSHQAFGKFKKLITGKDKRKTLNRNLKELVMNSLRWSAVIIMLLAAGGITGHFLVNYIKGSDTRMIETKVPVGSRGLITLADGSTVWLNAGSRLRYGPDFGTRNRIVHLEGEGFFNVAPDHKHTFKVSTSELEIEALGTSFNVKSYPQEGLIQTTLVTGSILVSRKKHIHREKGITLEPNQQITYYREIDKLALTDGSTGSVPAKPVETIRSPTTVQDPPRIMLTRGIDPELFTSWKDNRLIFDNETFESIAVKLERRFGARIIIQDEEIKNRRFKGRFDEITIEQALMALKFASPFEFQIKHDTIYISSEY
jgi:transmembrane sensor